MFGILPAAGYRYATFVERFSDFIGAGVFAVEYFTINTKISMLCCVIREKLRNEFGMLSGGATFSDYSFGIANV